MLHVWGRGFWWGNLKERHHLEDLGVDGRIILKLILQKHNARVDWIDLAQDRKEWRALVKAVMNVQVI
jgi:hypothetical protein